MSASATSSHQSGRLRWLLTRELTDDFTDAPRHEFPAPARLPPTGLIGLSGIREAVTIYHESSISRPRKHTTHAPDYNEYERKQEREIA